MAAFASAGCVTLPLFLGKGSVEAFVACIDLEQDQEPEVLQQLVVDWLVVVLKQNKKNNYNSMPVERVVFVPKGDHHHESVTFSIDDVGKHNHGLVIPVKCKGKAVCHAYTGTGVWWVKAPRSPSRKRIDFMVQVLRDPSPTPPGFLFKRVVLLPAWMRHKKYKSVYTHLFISFTEIDVFFLVETTRALLYSFEV